MKTFATTLFFAALVSAKDMPSFDPEAPELIPEDPW